MASLFSSPKAPVIQAAPPAPPPPQRPEPRRVAERAPDPVPEVPEEVAEPVPMPDPDDTKVRRAKARAAAMSRQMYGLRSTRLSGGARETMGA